MAKELRTSIVINKSPEKVWAVLTDFEKYPQWNPFIQHISGNPVVGKQITAKIAPPEGQSMVFTPIVLAFTPNKEFRWIGKLWIKGLFDGDHKFELIDNQNGTTTLIHSEKFGGILVGLFEKMIDNNTKKGFEQMNEQLKKRVENA